MAGRMRGRAARSDLRRGMPCTDALAQPDAGCACCTWKTRELDHELVLAQLRRGGLHVRRAARRHARPTSAPRCEQPLGRRSLSDYNLPGFSGLVALRPAASASGSDVPFILVSGEIGEDTAVEAMRNGASDYLLKNNLARLAPALLHAIEASRDAPRARSAPTASCGESKQRLRELAQHLQTSIEMERAAIAREIHDDVGGSLTALKFDLAWIARHADATPRCSRACSRRWRR